ncbi:MAG: ABC transporter ATP-binding protein [Chiayiivirga sp.]|uniref:ABC transporter ATP-binding protein n=1 Tax=Chiayiivirga sp. TaxID=2041042 RepID=UPI0025BE78F8|nr:ABC transporter ATP-binding protein [Chiayiivirga sp.]MCI1709293.1 ABC transporter ATP-binding protein [Chiayiivirga sp.]MCI1730693.1 ABC transporter ATP-binding protein [Chiayiivirga sp.]
MTLAAPAAPPLLALHEVHCEIAAQPVVRGVSFELAAGELGCLLGPSGCGKTTLLRAIAGFQPVARGRIDLRGEEASSANRAQPPERRGLGFVFQDLALFPHLDVASNVGFGLQALARGARVPRVRETLDLLGLADFAARYPHELSGGQQQRVALARALAPRPDLLLLDEPFSSLDARLRASLREELRDLLKRLGLAAVLVTHDQDEAFAFADRVGVMHAGKLEQFDRSFDIYHRPATPFVARFVGEGRFLRGRVHDAHGIDTTLGRLRSSQALAFAPGSAVHVLIRPDDIVPHESEPDGKDGIEASVVSAAFRGAEIHYVLRLGDGEEVSALFPSHHQHGIGDHLRVRLDLEHVVAFAAT